MGKAQRETQKHHSEQLVHQLIAAIDADPDKFNNYYELGSLLTRLGDYVQAEELFMKALAHFKQQEDEFAVAFLNYGLGNLYYEVDRIDEAIKYYNQVTDEKLKANAYLMLAQSYIKKDQYRQAIVYGLTAHELAEDDPEIDQILGDAFLALGIFDKAKEYYDLILRRHPGRADTQFNRGLVAMALDEPYRQYLEQAQQLNPSYYKRSERRIAEIEKTLQQLDGGEKP